MFVRVVRFFVCLPLYFLSFFILAIVLSFLLPPFLFDFSLFWGEGGGGHCASPVFTNVIAITLMFCLVNWFGLLLVGGKVGGGGGGGVEEGSDPQATDFLFPPSLSFCCHQ